MSANPSASLRTRRQSNLAVCVFAVTVCDHTGATDWVFAGYVCLRIADVVPQSLSRSQLLAITHRATGSPFSSAVTLTPLLPMLADSFMNEVVVRKAQVGDLPSITRVLTSAFEHHPLRQYLLPGVRRRRLAVACGDTVLFAEGMACGSALVGTINGRVAGVLCWLPPEAYPRSPIRKVVLSIARIPFLFCPPVGFKGMKFQPAVDAFHIKDPALYFTLAATHRDYQGKGVATQLLGVLTEQAERDALPIFLETSNHRNVSLYQKHGFQVVAEASPVEGGPTVFAMVRPSSSAA